MAEYLYRACDLCGVVDDGPRDVLVGTQGIPFPVDESVAQVFADNLVLLLDKAEIDAHDVARITAAFHDRTSQDRHLDCCAAAGCPNGTCGPIVEAAGGAKDAELRRFIMSQQEV